jgi:hypothetical protein
MSKTLRPMTLGEILDRTFEIYRSRLFIFAGIAALPALAMLGVHVVDTAWIHAYSLIHPFRRSGVAAWGLIVGLGFYHFAAFFQLLIMPAHVTLISALMREEACSFGTALNAVYSRWRSYLRVTVLKLFAVLVVPELLAVLLLVLLIAIANVASGYDGALGFTAFMIILTAVALGFAAFAFLGSCFALTMQIATLERQTGFGALRRSWQLSKGGRKRVFVMWLVILILQLAISVGVAIIARVVLLAVFRTKVSGAYLQSINLVTAVIASCLGPIYPIALTLIYYDQRIRREGYDIEWMMNVAGLNTLVPVVAEESALAFASTQTSIANSLEGPLP